MDELHVLTPEGWNTIMKLMGEFCSGFTIEEIAMNSDFEEDEIKTMLMVLFEGYAGAYFSPEEILPYVGAFLNEN